MKCIVLIAVIVASICWTASAFIPRVHRQNAGLVTVAMKRSSVRIVSPSHFDTCILKSILCVTVGTWPFQTNPSSRGNTPTDLALRCVGSGGYREGKFHNVFLLLIRD
jgi:hypothetical protein